MSYYLSLLKTALLIFPFLAIFISIPYIIIQYRKYGSVLALRSVIIYSFVLYLLCCYLLIILPLPSLEKVAGSATITPQLIPFTFFNDFIVDSHIQLNDPSTYLSALQSLAFLTIIFNIMLFIPLGIYLRYYFKSKWYHVLMIACGLSLFFELTQLTGLYGIYPKAYRIFDVDDLITNTFGGILGYYISPLFSFFLPNREKIDQLAYQKGMIVSFSRRFVAFLIDWFIISIFVVSFQYIIDAIDIISLTSSSIYEAILIYAIGILIFYIMVPILTGGQTVGKYIVKIKLVNIDDQPLKVYQYLLRCGLLYFVIIPSPLTAFILLTYLTESTIWLNIIIIILFAGFLFVALAFPIHLIIQILSKNKWLIYETISNTKQISTIKPINNLNKKESIVND